MSKRFELFLLKPQHSVWMVSLLLFHCSLIKPCLIESTWNIYFLIDENFWTMRHHWFFSHLDDCVELLVGRGHDICHRALQPREEVVLGQLWRRGVAVIHLSEKNVSRHTFCIHNLGIFKKKLLKQFYLPQTWQPDAVQTCSRRQTFFASSDRGCLRWPLCGRAPPNWCQPKGEKRAQI